MYKYGVVALAALVAGCSPKANPDESWKADCAKHFSQSTVDYMLCMKRKMDEEKATKETKAAENDSNDVRTSKIGHKKHFEDGLNRQRVDEAGADKVL